MKYIRLTGQLLGYVFYPIKKSPAFFVFMFVLGYVCNRLGTPRFSDFGVFELFLDLYILCLVLAAIPWKARRWIKGAVYVVMYTASVADMYCYVKFGSNFTPTILLLMAETTGGEASEFLKSYLSWSLIGTDLGWVLLILLAHILYNVFMALARRKRYRLVTDMAMVHRTAAFGLPLLGLLTIYMLERAVETRAGNKKAFVRLMTYDNIGDVEHELTRADKAELYLPVYRLAFSVYANQLAARQIDRLIGTTEKAAVDSCSFRSRNIVLIIGESCNRHHSQLYGYGKPTTPRQLQRNESGQMAVFSDVVSPWNLTSFVFKHVFSLYTVGDSAEWCDYPLFPELFRKAGYRVTFITNQFLPQVSEAVYDFSGGFFLNNPTLDKALFDVRNTALHRFDDGVLKDYDGMLADGRLQFSGRQDNNLIIMHLKGQHVNYRDRTPQDRKKFGPDDYDMPTLTRRDRWIMADYDNATLYNDSIVDEIIRRFERQDAVVVYMPDHGEECFGGGMRVFGRLHSADVDYRMAHEEFEIPFWIWWSEEYARKHPDVVRAVRGARRRPFMTDRTAHLLLYLGGVSCAGYRDEYNPLSPDYDADRPRILKNTVDYDKLRQDDEDEERRCEALRDKVGDR